jgi:muramoyltetrapeptide carboxypeptidase LdcA involved in peptidoglycan recycling|tara:strand:+ start:3445 stop:4485 length:1041 start_codon:yes stop_codon:yes gene_type:complete
MTVPWPTQLAVPQRLSPGDAIAIVSPSWGGPSVFPHRYEAGLACLRARFGFEIVEMPHARADADWLAANPMARAEDIMAAFADPRIKGVFASIGGDDAISLEPFLDLSVLSDNPKPLIGYSDTTAIHFACLKAGVQSLYGPSIMSGFAENCGISPTTEMSFRAVAMDGSAHRLPWSTEGWTDQLLDWADPGNQSRPRARQPSSGPRVLRGSGTVSGRLIGGCFEVLEMLKATPWWPPLDYWNGAVLFLESSEEAPAADHIRRWMRNFAAQGVLDRINAILLSRPAGMDGEGRAAQERAVLAALDERGLKTLPVVGNLDFGHTDPIVTLPYGGTARIDCDTAEIWLS